MERDEEIERPVIIYSGRPKDWLDYTMDGLAIVSAVSMIVYFTYDAILRRKLLS